MFNIPITLSGTDLSLLGVIAGLSGASLGATIAFLFNSRIERHKRTNELVSHFDSAEMVRSRSVVWKAKDHILAEHDSNKKYYDSVAWEELLKDPNHLLSHIQRVSYFWHRVAVTGVDWKICRQQLGDHYLNWYEHFYVHADHDLTEDMPGGWGRAKKERQYLAKYFINPRLLAKIHSAARVSQA